MGLFLSVYATAALTILFPGWIGRFDRWACSRLSRWFVVGTLAVMVTGVWSWVYLEGCRRGWWTVLAAWMRDHYS